MLVGPLPGNQEVVNFRVISNSGSSNSQRPLGLLSSYLFMGGYNKDLERREGYIVGAGKMFGMDPPDGHFSEPTMC